MVLGYLCAYLLTKVYIGIQKNIGFQILPCDDVDDASILQIIYYQTYFYDFLHQIHQTA